MSEPKKLLVSEVTPTWDHAYDPPEWFGNVISFRDATPADILAAVRTLPGVGEIVVDVKYDAEPFMKKGPFFVDYDYEVASDLDPGRYLVVPLSEEE